MQMNKRMVLVIASLLMLASNVSAQTLSELAKMGDIKGITKALKEGANIEERDGRGYTPMMVAVFHQQLPVVEVLLEHDAHACAADIQGNTPLMTAVYQGSTKIAERLIPLCHVDQRNRAGQTALMIAALSGQTDAAKWLLDAGADTSMVNSRGETAGSIAVRQGNVELIEILDNILEYDEY